MQGLLGLVICLGSVLPTKLQATTTNNITIRADCQSHCGDLMVPYPFGIGVGKNCSLNPLFDITCNTSFRPPRAFIRSSLIHVRSISDSELRVTTSLARKCYNSSAHMIGNTTTWTNLSGTPYSFSESNKFTLIGCNDVAVIQGKDNVKSVTTGCLTLCLNEAAVLGGNCSGGGCCQTSIPKGFKYFSLNLDKWSAQLNYVRDFNPCTYAFLAEENTFSFKGLPDYADDTIFVDKTRGNVFRVLDWAIGNISCLQAQKANSLACKSNSVCVDSSTYSNGGYRCKCREGYEGNPYLRPGCQDIDECLQSEHNCSNICQNTLGNYTCSCPKGNDGDGLKKGKRCKCKKGYVIDNGSENGTCRLDSKPPPPQSSQAQNSQAQNSQFLLGIAICIACVVIGVIWLYFIYKQRKILQRREMLFKQNGGEFLKEKLAGSRIESVKIFTVEELEKATNNYAENTIVGQGGYGTVYKGILSDKRVVAIKKSKVLDKSQREQFINEVIILTQINHRNVVKLLGCCLEGEVPLLVYEFISNNTLFYHIHNRSGGVPWLTWDNRLRIATESAGALAYLHSAASMPIIHRDFKSPNILLDENYTTKIADFGASRLVPLDHSQVTTLVQGTLGYLDPEYFHTSQLTDKSDVYSFGVVLSELLTSQKPLDGNRTPEERSLATHFVVSMKKNRLFEILEPRVRMEGTLEQLQAVAELGKRCLSLNSEDRPTMKEVAMELEGLRKFNKHPWAESNHDCGREETRSLMIGKEESDLYTVRLDQYSNNFGEYRSDTATIILQPNSPR